jgi:hypothetical protein
MDWFILTQLFSTLIKALTSPQGHICCGLVTFCCPSETSEFLQNTKIHPEINRDGSVETSFY